MALALAVAWPARACSPEFPATFLGSGDSTVFDGPYVRFTQELERLHLAESRFTAQEATNSFQTQTIESELADLETALKRQGIGPAERKSIRDAHAVQRQRLLQIIESNSAGTSDDEASPSTLAKTNQAQVEVTVGLPAEFSDYFEGAIVWHDPKVEDKSQARAAWERLLARPAADRRFKSTWAAFMLGRLLEAEEPEIATTYFQQVRELVGKGFKDSAGLAAASLGYEARIYYKQKDFGRAIDLYLQHLSSGDHTAPYSLREVARTALETTDSADLAELAAKTQSRKVLTAFLLAEPDFYEETPSSENRAERWLNAISAAGIQDAEGAAEMALIAYHNNQIETASKWLQSAGQRPLAQWLRAKLFMRQGKVDKAAALLSEVCRYFPLDQRETETNHLTLEDSLYMGRYGNEPVSQHVLGELGALRLSRRDFTGSLDALLRSGYWRDAAYVAERVLSVSELKTYVDQNWDGKAALAPQENQVADANPEIGTRLLQEKIRYLLARRLLRQEQGDEARPYFPEGMLAQYEALCASLREGRDESSPSLLRARALFRAAVITRTQGMELLGTEMAPDFGVDGGSFEEDPHDPAARLSPLLASSEERRRVTDSSADPDVRFHYRYHAGALGWEAARLMPNESSETAFVLWKTGSWFKGYDDENADVYYKALVRRNRTTPLGAAADRERWFPEMDADGNWIEGPNRAGKAFLKRSSTTSSSSESPASEAALAESNFLPKDDAPSEAQTEGNLTAEVGHEVDTYEVAAGDTLTLISRRLAKAGRQVSVAEIVAANPGLNPNRIQIGQKLVIP